MKHRWVVLVVPAFLFCTLAAAAQTPEEIRKEQNAARAAKLKADPANFRLALQFYGDQNPEKPFWNLELAVKEIQRLRTQPFALYALIDQATAVKLIDTLAASGMLGRMDDVTAGQSTTKLPTGPFYGLYVQGAPTDFRSNLGWGEQLLHTLDALRAPLRADAADKMDKLIAAARTGIPDPAATTLQAKLILKKDSYNLDPAQTGPEFVKQLKEPEKDIMGQKTPPPPPAVDMALELTNVGKDPVTIPLGGDSTHLDLKLEGPGAVTVPYMKMHTMEFRFGNPTPIEPGKSLTIPITRLTYGSRGDSMACYWTAPGAYTLTASYTAPLTAPGVEGIQNIRPVTFTAPPVKVNVLAPAAAAQGTSVTQAQALAAAEALLKEKNLAWGPCKVVHLVPGGGFWLYYATPEKETFLMGERVVIVSPDGKLTLPPRPDPTLKAELVLKTNTYTLDPAQSGPEFVKKLKEPDKDMSKLMPLPPAVEMSLELTNVGKDPVTIPLGGDETHLDLRLEGPGAVSVPYIMIHTQEWRSGNPTPVAPGESLSIPIARLKFGARGDSMACYWTAPGAYTLAASFTTPLGSRIVDGIRRNDLAHTYAAAPVKLTVTAAPPAPKPEATPGVSREKAIEAAAALLKEKALDWGQPKTVQQLMDGGWALQYASPGQDFRTKGIRTVLVSPEGVASLGSKQ